MIGIKHTMQNVYNFLQERHSEGDPGNWIWPHQNTTVEWFDWADGQPNNYHGQNCLVSNKSLKMFFLIHTMIII